jgi:DNA replication licensing factor MCM4
MCGIIGLDHSNSLREIHHKHINRLISVKGIVIRCSEIYPEMVAAVFKCCNCHNELQVILEDAKVHEPKFC